MPEEYDNLEPNNFWVLCSACHREIERLARIKPVNWFKYNQDWVESLRKFLEPK